MKKNLLPILIAGTLSSFSLLAAPLNNAQLDQIVNDTIKPLMAQQAIPGMAVAVVYQGKSHLYSYGEADIEAKRPVTADTLFELGSVSKTFTGIAAGAAINSGLVKLTDPAVKYAPQLNTPQWQHITMLNLATYTAGGLPLQVPDAVSDQQALWHYYQQWQPEWQPGTMRSYSNASIGLFGLLAVKNSGLSFTDYLHNKVLQPLMMTHTYIDVPAAQQKNYAWGYRDGKPVRVSAGMLDAEAYGVKTSVQDMAKYLQANIDPNSTPAVKQAILTSQARYLRVGNGYQGLGWEIYHWPVDAKEVIAASDNGVALKPHAVEVLTPAGKAEAQSWVHKTGSTNGFGSYIAFVPQQKVGIVMLANKSYPNPARVEAANKIITALTQH
ncbi:MULTISPECIES: class C beta-lactamase [Erwinia]|uniref:class C beta-lactamase n=1 Tax=Erwinia TaxID=551 RepID=UPI00105CAB5E|nr:class C beta-lactamase [Erwinia aphidicola]MCP2233442.1 beta-lactamase class C [Erwinia aphidicola]